jgi:hypothetical protein
MALASIIHPEHFEIGFVPSSDKAANRAKQLVDMNGSYRTRTHDMGGMSSNAQMSNSGLLTILGNTKVLTLCGEAVSYEDARSREEQLKIDMVRALGGEIAQMGAFVAEIISALSTDSIMGKDQQDKLFEMVTEIVALKNLTNLGALPEGQAKLEALITETANKIANTLLDGMDNKAIAPAIADFVHQMLSETAQKFDIPTLDEKVTKIEGRMNPEEYLANSVAAVIAELTGLLDAQDLSEETKSEIESLIEKMESAVEAGDPIPRDVMQALEGLTESHPAISVPESFTSSMETLSDANIVMKADTLGISVAHMQAIETTIETLENQQIEMADNADYTDQQKAEVESLIEKLMLFADDGVPLKSEAVKTLEGLADKFPEIASNIAPALAEVKDANMVVKADSLGVSVEQLKAVESNIEALTLELSNAEVTAEDRIEIEGLIEKLDVLSEGGQPLDRDTIAALDKLTDKYSLAPVDSKTFSALGLAALLGGGESTRPATPPTDGNRRNPEPVKNPALNPLKGDGEKSIRPEQKDTPPNLEPIKNELDSPVVGKDDNVQPAPPEGNKNTLSDQEKKGTESLEGDDKGSGNPETPNNGDDNLKQPEGDKPKPAEPEKRDTKQAVENSQERDGEKPNGPCCDNCQFAKTFNDVSRNEDGTVDLTLTNGDKVTVEAKDADKMIDAEVKDKLDIADQSWKKTLDQFDGDKVKAFEYLTEQNKKEADFSNKYVGPTTDFDGQPAVDALAQQMRAMKDSHSAPARSHNGKPSATGPFHECGPGCNHGTPTSEQENKTGQASVEIDTNTFRNPDSGDKPKKKKKTKSPSPK